jgi:hypothetical protein
VPRPKIPGKGVYMGGKTAGDLYKRLDLARQKLNKIEILVARLEQELKKK